MEGLFEMKIINIALIFILVTICLIIPLDMKAQNISTINGKKINYDLAIESSVDDAVESLVEIDTNRNLVTNKEECINNLYQSLYANFSITSDATLQEKLRAYIPVVLLTDQDGYYLYYSEIHKNSSDEKIIEQQWTEKKAYVYKDDRYIYSFTLNDYLKIYDKNTNQLTEGKFEDLKEQFSNSKVFESKEIFDEIRRKTIVNHIIDDMNYYINQHNRIAKHYGISYNFALPTIDKEVYYRTIDDISLFVFFQGYPYGISKDRYNRYSFAGARVSKSHVYYIERNNDDGKLYYHRATCKKLKNKTEQYYTKKECAQMGAFPCEECAP